MFCKNCGNQLPDDTKFCAFCGAVQDDIPAPPQPTAQYQPQQPAPQPQAPQYQPQQPVSQYQPAQPVAQEAGKGKKIGGIVMIVLGVLAFFGSLSNGNMAAAFSGDIASLISTVIMIGLVVGGAVMVNKSKQ